MRSISAIVLSTILPIGALAQKSSVLISPVPGITNASPVPASSTQYVFVGPNAGQLTISYPSALAGIASADRVTFTVPKLDQVMPTVSSQVTEDADGSFTYTYAVSNDKSAPDSIGVWSVALPASDGALSTTHSTWTTSAEATTQPIPAAGLVSMLPVALVSWHAPAAALLAPNSTVSDFVMTSRYRPGLTLIYARSGQDYAVPPSLPAQVNAQLAVMRQRDWMNRKTVGIGPRFPIDWTKDVIAADFKTGITRLVLEGSLDAASNFVTLLNASLDALINSPSAPIAFGDLTAAASTTTEKNIANAISISLQ